MTNNHADYPKQEQINRYFDDDPIGEAMTAEPSPATAAAEELRQHVRDGTLTKETAILFAPYSERKVRDDN